MGAGGDVEFVGVGGSCASMKSEIGGRGDHGGVVGGEFGFGEEELGFVGEFLGGFFAKERIGSDAAGKKDGGGLVFFYGFV